METFLWDLLKFLVGCIIIAEILYRKENKNVRISNMSNRKKT